MLVNCQSSSVKVFIKESGVIVPCQTRAEAREFIKFCASNKMSARIVRRLPAGVQAPEFMRATRRG